MELILDLMGESDFTVIAWRQAKKPTTSRRPAALVHLPLVYRHPLTKKIPSTSVSKNLGVKIFWYYCHAGLTLTSKFPAVPDSRILFVFYKHFSIRFKN
jgi:hypothetical protein